jgi:pyrroline-5-carboxylate reductase
MAAAIIEGVVKAGVMPADEILIDKNRSRAGELHNSLNVKLCDGLRELILQSDMLVLAVKPNVIKKVIEEAGETLADKAVVSIAAGWTSEMLMQIMPKCRILRVMPNTPALVGAGMSAMSKMHTLTAEEAQLAERVFSSFGKAVWVEEYMMEAVIGVSGSGPAYAFMFIEAMADGGVKQGLPRATAYRLAAQTALGTAKMILETGMHPGQIKDMVTSPGGTTIEGCEALERGGMRGAVIDCINKAAEKSKKL